MGVGVSETESVGVSVFLCVSGASGGAILS